MSCGGAADGNISNAFSDTAVFAKICFFHVNSRLGRKTESMHQWSLAKKKPKTLQETFILEGSNSETLSLS